MSKMGQEFEKRLNLAKQDLYEALVKSKDRLTHTRGCNRHAFRGMTMLAVKTMEDCGYNNNCDCGLAKHIEMVDNVLAKVEGK